MRHFVSVLFCLIGFTQLEAICQSRDTVLVRKFTQDNGLSSYNIRKILQDKWGFIWLSTQEGLSRFDGNSFLNFSKNGSQSKKISGSDIRDIVEDSSRSTIWALSSEEGTVDAVSTVDLTVKRTIKIPNTGSEEYNLSMIQIGNELWVGSSTGVKILNCQENKFLQTLNVPSRPMRSNDYTTQMMLKDDFGNVWVCYWGYGIVIYRGTDKSIIKSIKLKELEPMAGVLELRIFTGIRSAKGEVLFGTSKGIKRIGYEKDYSLTIQSSACAGLSELNRESVDWIIRESDSTLLISGHHYLFRFDNSLSHFTRIDEFSRTYETNWLSSVLCMYKDHSGNLWLGCQEGLAYLQRRKSPFKPYSHDRSSLIKLDHVFAIRPIRHNKILVGLRNGLVEIDNLKGKYRLFDESHLYQYIFTDLRGYIHVSRQEGLFIFKRGNTIPIQRIYPEFAPYASYSVNSHLALGDTLIILGTENNQGLLLWNPSKSSIRAINARTVPALGSDIVNNIYVDKSGRVWVLSDNLITILSADLLVAKRLELRKNDGTTPYGLFFNMSETNECYYITSYGNGVLEVDKSYRVKRIFNRQNGLSNDGVYQVYSILGNKLLVTSNSGLSQIDLTIPRVDRYFQSDGLHSNAFEEASGLEVSGKIYAGGVNGFTVIDPRHIPNRTSPPQLYLVGVEIRKESGRISFDNLLMKDLTIPNDALQTSISFVGLNYPNPDRTRYAYRILEESGRWVDNGNRSSLVLIGHPPGRYTIEIKATGGSGWSNTVRLALNFQPRWYQTWWFRLLIVVIAIGGAYQIYRFRISQIRREHAIRQSLANDLHDDLGSSMNSVSVYASLALLENNTSRYLPHIKRGAQDSIAIMRDIIWILDERIDTIGQLADRIYQFANPLCEAKGVIFRIDIDPSIRENVLKSKEKRNIYMIIKEAINNCIKYAKARKLTIFFRENEQETIFTVTDDGIGCNLLNIQRGNGLDNMQRRSHEIGYNFEIESKPGTGTSITLAKLKDGEWRINIRAFRKKLGRVPYERAGFLKCIATLVKLSSNSLK